ncbi:MAG: hypothetical protein M3Y48_13775 [Actinomycetota bacterium]|nr:hypothetical protein [Actinomycetota bacterium]
MASVEGLEIYLNDHLAGATTGTELANKIKAEYADTSFGPFLAELAGDIDQDKVSLEELMERLGIAQSPIKQATSWIAEKASRLKLSETMSGGREMKRLMEFEMLSLGIEGKASLWRALISVSDSHPALATTDLARLEKRAESQRAGLEENRIQVAKVALSQ